MAPILWSREKTSMIWTKTNVDGDDDDGGGGGGGDNDDDGGGGCSGDKLSMAMTMMGRHEVMWRMLEQYPNSRLGKLAKVNISTVIKSQQLSLQK